MHRRPRKTTPKVKDGKVQKKNNTAYTAREGYYVDRMRPRAGYMHVVTKRDIHDFVQLIPEWDQLSVGIDSIILAPGPVDYEGLYDFFPEGEKTATIYLAAWPRDLTVVLYGNYYREHKWCFDILGLTSEKAGKDVRCYFDQPKAKAFTLMHVFLHELGHHVDRMRTKNQTTTPGEEPFAEKFSVDMFHKVWPAYTKHFGQP